MAIQFTQSVLSGSNLFSSTSLQFGPDGRLYAIGGGGQVKVMTVAQTASGYQVTASETIDLVKNIANHNDDGTFNAAVVGRQSLGILVTGSAANPVIYVTSSDPRSGAGTSQIDSGLDTNSGTLSRLTKNAQGVWEKVDLVRGLPRSEELHSTNGMAIDPTTGKLLMAVGGQTNAGAPSANFAYAPEYSLSAAILQIDLPALDALPTQIDQHGAAYKYNLPTVDDPTRANNPNGTEPNDPWGGNNGLNMAKLVQGGPVQIWAPGFRNAYDIVVTHTGQVYTWDNGANPSWGGIPLSEDPNLITNQPNNTTGQTNNAPGLNLVTAGYYGGHPNPIRANPAGAGLYDPSGNPIPLPADWPPVPVSMRDVREADYQLPGVANGALYTTLGSLNGLGEYASTAAFAGEMFGNLLVAKLNDDSIYRVQLNATGTGVLAVENITPTGVLGNGFAIDVVSPPDGSPFAGTIWVASYGGGITVLTPADGSVIPPDTDADDDGLNDLIDRFAVDPNNGTQTVLNAGQTLAWLFNQNVIAPGPSNSLLNLGFTGVMTNLTQSFRDQFDAARIIPGGAASGVLVQNVAEGSAVTNRNTQLDGMQFGVNVTPGVRTFTIESVLDNPFDAVATPQNFQNVGIFLGTGDQDNYLKIVAGANNGPSIEVAFENAGVSASQLYSASIFGSGVGLTPLDTITLRLTVNVDNGVVTPSWTYTVGTTAAGGGQTFTASGTAVQLAGSTLQALQGTYTIVPPVPNGDATPVQSALAVGLIATSAGPATPFDAYWGKVIITASDAVPDSDDDNDGLDNGLDRFALDPSNGFATKIVAGQTLNLPLTPSSQAATPFAGGFNGVMTTGTGSYTERYDPARVTVGPEGLRINGVTEGSAVNTRNTQLDGLQRGFSLDPGVSTVVFSQTIDNPFNSITTPANFQNVGFFVGSGDQDNYIKVVAGWNNGAKFEVMRETAAVTSSTLYTPTAQQQAFAGNANITAFDTITMTLSVNVATGAATPTWSWTVGKTAVLPGTTYTTTGAAVTLTGATLQALQGTATVPVSGGTPVVSGAAFGVLATSAGVAVEFDQIVKSMSITASGTAPAPAPQPAQALLTVTSPDTLNASTTDLNSFVLANQSQGGQQITRVVIDLTDGALPDALVFDPQANSNGKAFTVDGQTGTFTVTPTYAVGGGASGYSQLILNFTGFDAGESLNFSIDTDPLSLRNQGTGNTASGVSGVELTGSSVAVTYSDKSTQVAEIFGANGPGAALALATTTVQAAPTVSINGVTDGTLSVSSGSQTLLVNGAANSTVRVLLMTTEKQVVASTGSFDANTATAVNYLDVVLDGAGQAQASITIPQNKPLVVAAAVVNAQGNAVSLVSNDLIVVNSVAANQPPSLTGAPVVLANGSEDTAYTVTASQLLQGWTDADGDTLSVQGLTSSSGTVLGTGPWTITPALNFNGGVSLSYTVIDGKGGAVPTTRPLTFNAVNDAPTLTGVPPTLANGTEDTPYTIQASDLVAGYSDVENDTLTPTGLSSAQGTITNNGNGTFNFAPNANFNGQVTLSYSVNDGNGGTLPTTRTFNLAAVNDAPALTGAPGTVPDAPKDATTTIAKSLLLQGYTDADGDTLTILNLSSSVGQLVDNGASVSFTPTAGYTGPVTLNFDVSDGVSAPLAAVRSFNVTAANQLPAFTSSDTVGTVRENLFNATSTGFTNIAVGTVTAVDPEASPVSYALTSDSSGGAFQINAVSGLVTVRDISLLDYEGAGLTTDAGGRFFSLTVRASDGIGQVSSNFKVYLLDSTGTAATVNSDYVDGTSANDSFSPGTGNDYVFGSGGADTLTGGVGSDWLFGDGGTDTLSAGDWDDYVWPGTGNDAITLGNGKDTVVLNAVPGAGNVPVISDFAPFAPDRIWLVNDRSDLYAALPTGALSTAAFDVINSGPAATAATRIQYNATTGALFYDADGTGPTAAVQIATLPTGLGSSLTAANFTAGAPPYPFTANLPPALTGSPAALPAGTEDTTYQVTLAQLLDGFTDPEGAGALSVTIPTVNGGLGSVSGGASGPFIVTPNANVNGPITLNYNVVDVAGATTAATRTFTLNPVNDVPALTGTAATLPAGTEDVTYSVTLAQLLQGYTDADGDTLSVGNFVVTGNLATVGGSGAGPFTFTTAQNYFGPIQFSYDITDGNGGVVSSAQSFTLAANNLAPALTGAQDALVEGQEDVSYTITAAQLLQGFTDGDGDTLSLANVAVSGGTGTVSGPVSGVYTVVPTANYNGTVVLTYNVQDTRGASTAATRSFSLATVNDAPTAGDVTASGNEDTTITVVLQGNDVENQLAGYNLGTLPGNGTLTSDAAGLNPVSTGVLLTSGTLYFHPAANFHGQVSFNYAAVDAQGASSAIPAQATITVISVNDAPAAAPVSVSGNEDGGAITIALAGSDNDGALDLKDYTVTSLPTGGTLALNANGSSPIALNTPFTAATIYFLPNANVDADTSFQYVVRDQANATSGPATVSIDIVPVNDAPSAGSGLGSGNNTDAYIPVSLAGTDLEDGNVAKVAIASLPSNGTLYASTSLTPPALAIGDVVNGTTVYFVRTPGFNGTADSFTFKAVDSAGLQSTNTGTANITITILNTAPDAVNVEATGDEDAASIELTLSATDTDGTIAGYVVNTLPQNGTLYTTLTPAPVAVVAGQQFTSATLHFVPNANFHGDVVFGYTAVDNLGGVDTATATVHVTSVNDVPVAAAVNASGNEDDAKIAVTLQANDADGTPIASWKITTAPTHGQLFADAALTTPLVLNGTTTSAQVWFVPAANFNGAATFQYVASDGTAESAPATATIDVAAINDAPTVQSFSVNGTEDGSPVAITLAGSDVEDGTLTQFTIVSLPTNGTLYATANPGVPLNANDVVGSALTFLPDGNFNGQTVFTYTARDAQNLAAVNGTVTIDIDGENDAPTVPALRNLNVAEDTPLLITLSGSDLEDGALASVIIDTLPSNGTLTTDAAGTLPVTVGATVSQVYFHPAANYFGTGVSFTYHAVDSGSVSSNTGTVAIEVTSVNDVPALTGAAATLAAGTEDVAYTIQAVDLLQGWTDVDGGTPAVANLSATNGSLVDNLDGSYTFTATNANFNGAVTLSYDVVDGQGGSVAATLGFSIDSVNDVPALTGAAATLAAGTEDVAYTIQAVDLLQGWTDVDGGTPAVANLSATNGSLVDNLDGSYTFTATNANFNGAVTLSYDVVDGQGGSVAATLGFSIDSVNDVPALTGAAATLAAGTEDVAYTIQAVDLLQGWTDVDGGTLAVANLSATNGSLVDNLDGSYTFTATNANFNGAVTLSYDVVDGQGGSVAATLGFSIDSVNDVPALTGAAASLAAGTEDVAYTIQAVDLLQGWTDVDGGTPAVANLSATNGSLVDNLDGSYTFTATNANFNGAVTLSYDVVDGQGGSVAATLGFSIDSVNDVPALTGAAATLAAGTEDNDYTFLAADLLEGWTDADGGTLAVANLSATNGSLVDNLDGSYTFTATNANFNGAVTLSYDVVDGQGGSVPATLGFSIDSVNDVPALTQAAATLDNGFEDSSYTFYAADLLQGWTDDDGDPLSIENLVATGGDVVDNLDGSYTFTATSPNLIGTVTLSYDVVDGQGGSTAATLDFELAAVNDAPALTASPASLTNGVEDEVYTVFASDLLQGWTDAEFDALSVVDLAIDHGSVTDIGGGQFEFTLDGDYNGPVTVSYLVEDGNGGSTAASLDLFVDPVNDAPTVNAVSVNDNPISAYTAVMLDASDVDGSVAFYTVTFDALAGHLYSDVDLTVELFSGDSVSTQPLYFVENVGFEGSTTFSYTATDDEGLESETSALVTITLTSNTAPTAQPVSVTGQEDAASIAITLDASDPDVGDGIVSYTILTLPANGTLYADAALTIALSAGGETSDATVYFVPDADSNGEVSFDYQAADNSGVLSNVATVTVTVESVNDAPALTGSAATLADGTEDTAYSFSAATLLQGWTDVDGGTPALGTVTADHGTVNDLGGGDYSLTPDADYHGPVTLSYSVEDGQGGSTPATLALALLSVNDLPTLTGPAAALPAGTEDTAYTVSKVQLLTGWADADLDTLDITSLGSNGGTVVDNGNGTYTVNPTANVNGPFTLSYQVTDGQGGNVAATLGYTLASVNDAPALTGSPATLANGTEDTAYTFSRASLLQGWTDVDGGTLAVSGLVSNRGTVVDNGNGTYTMTPTANANGAVTLSYNVTDGQGGSVATTRGFNLAAVNDAPAFTSGATIATIREHLINAGSTGFSSQTLGTVAASDVEGNAITYSIVTDPSGGAFRLNATTGVLTVRDVSNLDSEGTGLSSDAGGSFYSLTLRATDSVGAQTTQAFKVYMTNVTAITPTTGNDMLDGNASGNTVALNSGNDFFWGDGGVDNVNGGVGWDWIFGGAGNDVLNGGDWDDTLWGGTGNDNLTGGVGRDTFVFNTTPGAGNVDTITDFAVGADRIFLVNDFAGLYTAIPSGTLSAAAFDVIGQGAAATAATRIAYNPTTGGLFYDADGSGGTAAVQFATLTTNLALTAGNIVVGPPLFP